MTDITWSDESVSGRPTTETVRPVSAGLHKGRCSSTKDGKSESTSKDTCVRSAAHNRDSSCKLKSRWLGPPDLSSRRTKVDFHMPPANDVCLRGATLAIGSPLVNNLPSPLNLLFSSHLLISSLSLPPWSSAQLLIGFLAKTLSRQCGPKAARSREVAWPSLRVTLRGCCHVPPSGDYRPDW